MPIGDAIKDAVNVLGVAGSITTVLSLAALSLLIAFLLARQWLHGKRGAVREAIEHSDNEALARLLGGTAVPLDTLTADQKFTLATEELRTRSRSRLIGHTLMFFAFLALLGFALVLALWSGPRGEVQKVDPLLALDVLQHVPPDRRSAACRKLLSGEECVRAEPLIATLAYRAPSAAQTEAVETTLAQGGVTQAELKEIAACGGSYDFRVQDKRLTCADGTPLPQLTGAQSRPLQSQEALVFHHTASPDNSFVSGARLLAEGRPPTLKGPLAHILISRSGAIAQIAPFDRTAYHVGPGQPWRGHSVRNSNSIGVEMINQGTKGYPYTEAQIAAAKGIARALTQAYGIRVIVGHSDIAPHRKLDPGPQFPIGAVRAASGLPAE